MLKQKGLTLIELIIMVVVVVAIGSIVKNTVFASSATRPFPKDHFAQPALPTPTCVNGYLMVGQNPVIHSGSAVKC